MRLKSSVLESNNSFSFLHFDSYSFSLDPDVVSLSFAMYDRDAFSNDFMGTVEIPIAQFKTDFDAWYFQTFSDNLDPHRRSLSQVSSPTKGREEAELSVWLAPSAMFYQRGVLGEDLCVLG